MRGTIRLGLQRSSLPPIDGAIVDKSVSSSPRSFRAHNAKIHDVRDISRYPVKLVNTGGDVAVKKGCNFLPRHSIHIKGYLSGSVVAGPACDGDLSQS